MERPRHCVILLLVLLSMIDALYMLAEGHITLGDNLAAIELYEELLKLDPDDKYNYINPRLEWLHSQ